MRGLLWNVLLALVWAAGTGEFSLQNLAVGFVVGFAVMFLARRMIGEPSYFQKIGNIARLLVFFLWELILANLRVAHEVVTPTRYIRPAMVAVPLDARTDGEITTLGNLITLTPDSVTVDVSDDRKVIYIHCMFVHDPADFRRKIKDEFERRVLEVFR